MFQINSPDPMTFHFQAADKVMADEATCASYQQAFPHVHVSFPFLWCEIGREQATFTWGSSLARSREAHDLWAVFPGNIVRYGPPALYQSCGRGRERYSKRTGSGSLTGSRWDCRSTGRSAAGYNRIVPTRHDAIDIDHAAGVVHQGHALRAAGCPNRLRRESKRARGQHNRP